MSTSAGWNSVLDGIINENDCSQDNVELGQPGDCGSQPIGIAFLLSYLVISFLIIINMYIAVILENYSQATEDVQEGLTDDDYDMYYEIWQQFDPEGTQYINYHQLSDFLDVLEPPLQIHKPNKYKIISMDIPICKGDLCYCVDVLDALTKDFFARKGNPVEETAELGEVTAHTDRPGYEPISSTLWRQREDYCARLIQGAWRRRGKYDYSDDDDDDDDDMNDDNIPEEDEEDEEEEGDDNVRNHLLPTGLNNVDAEIHHPNLQQQHQPEAENGTRRRMNRPGPNLPPQSNNNSNEQAVNVVVHSRSSSNSPPMANL